LDLREEGQKPKNLQSAEINVKKNYRNKCQNLIKMQGPITYLSIRYKSYLENITFRCEIDVYKL